LYPAWLQTKADLFVNTMCVTNCTYTGMKQPPEWPSPTITSYSSMFYFFLFSRNIRHVKLKTPFSTFGFTNLAQTWNLACKHTKNGTRRQACQLREYKLSYINVNLQQCAFWCEKVNLFGLTACVSNKGSNF